MTVPGSEKKTAAPKGNLMVGADFKSKATAAIDRIADVMSLTLGPLGSNVFCEDQFMQHFVSKDGYTIIQRMAFADPVEKCVLNFVQKVSSKLNRTIGDGTTTAVVVAAEMFKQMEGFKATYQLNDRLLAAGVSELVSAVVKRLGEMRIAIPSTEAEGEAAEAAWGMIRNVATVSANNDAEVGDRVVEAMRRVGATGAVKVSPAYGSETTTVFTSGIEVEQGMIMPILMNNPEERCFEAAGNVFVIMSDEPIGGQHIRGFSVVLHDLINVRKRRDGENALVILAPNYDEQFMTFLMQNKMKFKDAFHVVAVTIANRSAAAKDRFMDLATYTNCQPWAVGQWDTGDFDAFAQACAADDGPMGRIGEVKVTEKRSVFAGSPAGAGTVKRASEIAERLLALEKADCETRDNSEEMSLLRQRIRALSGSGVATIMVGGDSEQEKKARVYLVDDAVCAARSALRHGVLPGCCLSTMAALKEIADGAILPGIGADGVRKYIRDEEERMCSGGRTTPEQLKSGIFLKERTRHMLVPLLAEAFLAAYLSFYSRVTRQDLNFAVHHMLEFAKCGLVVSIADLSHAYFVPAKQEHRNPTSLLTSAESDAEVIRSAASIAMLISTSQAFASWGTVFEEK